MKKKNTTYLELIMVARPPKTKKLSLFFKLDETDFAQRYLAEIEHALKTDPRIFNPDRTYHFPGDKRDSKTIINLINECIDEINEYKPETIKMRLENPYSQDDMNRLHRYFEILSGPLEKPSDFQREAPVKVKWAIYRYNLLIHRLEDVRRVETRKDTWNPPPARMVINYIGPRRIPYRDEDYNLFTLRVFWGRWYVDYFESGKPLWDYFQDEDVHVGDNNIKPLRTYSADGMIYFAPTEKFPAFQKRIKNFENWWKKNEEKMSTLGFKWGDPRNALGNIPVAKLCQTRGKIAGKSIRGIHKLIGRHPLIGGIKIHYPTP